MNTNSLSVNSIQELSSSEIMLVSGGDGMDYVYDGAAGGMAGAAAGFIVGGPVGAFVGGGLGVGYGLLIHHMMR